MATVIGGFSSNITNAANSAAKQISQLKGIAQSIHAEAGPARH